MSSHATRTSLRVFRRTLLAVLLAAVPSATPAQVVTDTAVVPDIVVEAIDGDSVRLHALLAPKLTLIVKWSTWCVGCIIEMPFLKEFDEKWRPRGVHVVSIFEQDTAVGKAQTIIRENELPYPVILDPKNAELTGALPGLSLPNGYIVKADGKVVIRYVPTPNVFSIENQIQYFLDRYKLAASTPVGEEQDASRGLDVVTIGLRVAEGGTAGQSMVLHLTMDHADGIHTWPHEPVVPEEFRGVSPRATGIGRIGSPQGVIVDHIDWPPPVPVSVQYTGYPVDLPSYTGVTTVAVHLTLKRDLVESDTVRVPLSYQACDAEICYPPVRVEVKSPLLE